MVSQTDGKGRLRPIGYFSKKLSPAEYIYEIHDKELLAIISTIRHFKDKPRSVNRTFIVLPDHRILLYFMTSLQLKERQICWYEELTNYVSEIKFGPGVESRKTDILNRKSELQQKDSSDIRLKRESFSISKKDEYHPLIKIFSWKPLFGRSSYSKSNSITKTLDP